MNVRPLLIANATLIAVMAAVTAWFWPSIPADAQIPVHWGLSGVPDRFGSKYEGLLFLPAMAAALTAVFWFLPRIDPRRRNIQRSSRLWNAGAIGAAGLLAYLQIFLVLSATGRQIDIGDYLVPALAALFIVIGNYLPKTRSNWFAGVRTPWTLSSEYSWLHTHRWSGWMFIASGLIGLAVWIVVGAQSAIVALIAGIIAATAIAVVLSYYYWKTDPDRAPEGTANGEA